MHIITKKRINEYCDQFPKAADSLRTWYYSVQDERWENSIDVRKFSNSADFLGDHRAVFNIKGNHYRLIVDVFYAYGKNGGTVLVRWFGTHKKYDGIDARLVK